MPTVPVGILPSATLNSTNISTLCVWKTHRAAGGKTAEARWAAKMVSFLLDNDALKIPIDTEIELPLASDGGTSLERSKLMTLQSQAIISLAATCHGLIQEKCSRTCNIRQLDRRIR